LQGSFFPPLAHIKPRIQKRDCALDIGLLMASLIRSVLARLKLVDDYFTPNIAYWYLACQQRSDEQTFNFDRR